MISWPGGGVIPFSSSGQEEGGWPVKIAEPVREWKNRTNPLLTLGATRRGDFLSYFSYSFHQGGPVYDILSLPTALFVHEVLVVPGIPCSPFVLSKDRREGCGNLERPSSLSLHTGRNA